MKKIFSNKPMDRQEYSYRIFFWCLVAAIAICLVLAVVTAFGNPPGPKPKQSIYKVLSENLQMNRIKSFKTESLDSVKAFISREIDYSKGNITIYLTFKQK